MSSTLANPYRAGMRVQTPDGPGTIRMSGDDQYTFIRLDNGPAHADMVRYKLDDVRPAAQDDVSMEEWTLPRLALSLVLQTAYQEGYNAGQAGAPLDIRQRTDRYLAIAHAGAIEWAEKKAQRPAVQDDAST